MDGTRGIYVGEGIYRLGFGVAGDHLKDLHVNVGGWGKNLKETGQDALAWHGRDLWVP